MLDRIRARVFRLLQNTSLSIPVEKHLDQLIYTERHPQPARSRLASLSQFSLISIQVGPYV